MHFGYEKTDSNVGSIVRWGVALGVVVAVVLLVSYWTLKTFTRERAEKVPLAVRVSEPGKLPPAPRLQTSPPKELRAMRNSEDAILNTYGWVDRTNGIVRIPVERAIDLLAERSLPVRSQAAKQEGAQ